MFTFLEISAKKLPTIFLASSNRYYKNGSDTQFTTSDNCIWRSFEEHRTLTLYSLTINDIVYLFGIARSEEELEKVASIASNISGVQKVVSHVKVQKLARKTKSGSNNLDSTNIDSSGSSEYLIDQGEDLTLENVGNDW